MKKAILISFALAALTLSAFAQVLPDLQNSFNEYTTNALQEKLFVHTDKNAYTAGELLWFKIYDVDGVFMKPLDVSKVVYVELLDKNQTAILQTKIEMKDGAGNGSLYIPVTVSTDNVVLRAYTSWMKNFSPEYYFTKTLSIINPLKSPDPFAQIPAAKYDVQFFAEGGNLVNGIASTVGFKAADQWGHGVAFKGAILNQQNDTVARFEPLKFGLGHFTFKPENNTTYHAVIKIGGTTIQQELPAVNATGYVMNVKENGTGQLSVTVKTNVPVENVYLFAQTHNVIKLVQAMPVNNGTATFTIEKSKLGDGISQLTIFNSDKKPVCERLYFKRPTKSLTLTASTNQQQYSVRKKVDLAIDAKNHDDKPLAADLSVSVYRIDSLQTDNKTNILSYLWLSSDLRGYIESPEFYFNNTEATANEAADNLMLTQGWRSFAWSDVLDNKPRAFNFLPEFNGPVVTARLTTQPGGQPQAGIVAYMGIVGKSVQLSSAKSDALGRLMFNMKRFYGPAELITETNTEIDTAYHIDLLTPFSEQFAKTTLPPLTITPAMQTTFDEQNIGMQVQNIYSGPKLKQFYDPNADSSAFFGTPVKTYLLDNYTRFVTIEEVMREYVHEVTISHLHDKFHINVLSGKGFLAEGDPMVLVDGIPFFNMNKVFAIDPLKIRKLDVVPNTYNLGPSFENGIFSFTSYKGDLAGAEINPHAVIVDYDGLQKERKFYSPVYDTELQAASRMPDFRSLLYWSPSVNTDAKGKSNLSFFTSDQYGKYIGVIQGISANGEAGSQTFGFEVKGAVLSQ